MNRRNRLSLLEYAKALSAMAAGAGGSPGTTGLVGLIASCCARASRNELGRAGGDGAAALDGVLVAGGAMAGVADGVLVSGVIVGAGVSRVVSMSAFRHPVSWDEAAFPPYGGGDHKAGAKNERAATCRAICAVQISGPSRDQPLSVRQP